MTPRDRVEELTLKLVDEELDEAEAGELRALCETDAASRERHQAILEQEILLRGERTPLELAPKVMAYLQQVAGDRVTRGVMAHLSTRKPAKPPARSFVGSRRFIQLAAALAAAAVLVVVVRDLPTLTRRARPQEMTVFGEPVLAPGTTGAYRVFVRDARANKAVHGARVRLALIDAAGAAVWEGSARSDDDGLALLQPAVRVDVPEGEYRLKVTAESTVGESAVERTVKVKRSFKVFLTTDKPLYQPGQKVRIRTLTLASSDLRPAARRNVLLEVRDSRGNKVFKKGLAASSFGIAAANFALADEVNLGSYTISATVGDTTSERSVTVERYALPKYRVDLITDRSFYAPGDTVTGELRALYVFGQPVQRAQVTLTASEMVERLTPLATIEGTTSAGGRYRFKVRLPESLVGQPHKGGDAVVSLEARVVDSARHVQKKTLELTVSSRPIHIAVFPEGGALLPGVENTVYVVSVYPDGRPASTSLIVQPGGHRVKTSAGGLATLRLTPASAQSVALELTATDAKGTRVVETKSLPVNQRVDAFLLRTDRAIYQAGERVALSLLTAARARSRVFVDVVKDGRTALMKAIDVNEGRGELALDLPQGLVGTVEIHAYRPVFDGGLISDTRLIQVLPSSDLRVEAKLDRETYRPAQRAVLDVVVRRSSGEPAVAALGLAGVDEAVFALQEMRPGLERIYFLLQEELLKPRAEIHEVLPLDHSGLLDRQDNVSQTANAARALVAMAQPRPPGTMGSESYFDKVGRIAQERAGVLLQITNVMVTALLALFVLLTMPVLAYSVSRLWRREPLGDSVEAAAREELRKALRGVSLWWCLGFLLPVAAVLVVVFLSRFPSGEAAFVAAAVPAVVSSIRLFTWTSRARRSVTPEPALCRLLGLVAAAYFVALLTMSTWTGAAWLLQDVRENLFIVSLLVIVGMALLLAGAIPAASRTVLQPVGAGTWIKVMLSRLVIGALPPVLGLFLVSAPKRAEMAAPRRMMNAVLPAASVSALEQKGEEQAELKAPARVRRHFPETLIWRPEIITDERGHARLSIPLADSITTWRLNLSAVSARGELGETIASMRVFQDFFVDLDLPATLTQHDEIEVPAAIYSYLDRPQMVRLTLAKQPWFQLEGAAQRNVTVAAKQVTNVTFKLRALAVGRHRLTLRAAGSELGDAVEREVIVEPDGREITRTASGELTATVAHRFDIPEQAVTGASKLLVKIYPGAFSQVVEGLDAIFQLPYGCFEQTSSTTYPNLLALAYLRRTRQLRPEVELKALSYIQQGYQRLLTFEVPGGGFEWFGHAPAHQVLTAYGLMEFQDMSAVHEVDPVVIRRTRDWLYSKQRSDGTWALEETGIAEGAISRQRGKALRTTAYIAWALAEASPAGALDPRLAAALDWVARQAATSDDAYSVASAASALVAGRRPEAASVLDRLAGMKTTSDGDVFWKSREESVTYSLGDVLDVETTALAAGAFLKAGRQVELAHQALRWLIKRKDPRGIWHSTQATVLALRALLLGAAPTSELQRPVKVRLAANGQTVRTLDITPQTSDVFHQVNLTERLRTGANTVTLSLEGKGRLAYQVVATHYLPHSEEEKRGADRPALGIDLRYDALELRRNDQLTARLSLRFNREGVARMLIVDLGIPAGFEVVRESLDSLKERRLIERFTVAGRQVTLYIRTLEGGKPLELDYKLRAKYPVRVQAPPARLYPYYQPELEVKTGPTRIVVL